MALPVDVDLASAELSYRSAAGELRWSQAADRVSVSDLWAARPWRTFRWYFGQRHYSGTYWSATMSDHVIYEPRLELSCLLQADFSKSVRAIAAQPFLLTVEVDGQVRRHIPDFFWDTDEGPVVVDVVRRERLDHPKIVVLCEWTRRLVRSLGWEYRVVSEPPETVIDNVRFVAGYRRPSTINTPARSVFARQGSRRGSVLLPRRVRSTTAGMGGLRLSPAPARGDWGARVVGAADVTGADA